MYFWTVCVVFSRARIAFPKKLEVKHTIYFEWPNCTVMGAAQVIAAIAIGKKRSFIYIF